MKKTNFILSLVTICMSITSVMAQTTSLYCDTPSGHLGDPNFGDINSHINISISNIDAHSMFVKISPRAGSATQVDFLQVNSAEFPAIVVGQDEGTVLDEYKAIISFTETPPTEVTLQILWSNPGWDGRWMMENVVVPFDAVCGENSGGEETGDQDGEFLIDFEDSSSGIWAPVEGYVDIRNNPSKAGVNMSDKSLFMIRGKDVTAFWAGAIQEPCPHIIASTGRYLHAKMYRTNSGKPKIKISNEQPLEISPLSTIEIVETQWQDVVFDISGVTARQFLMFFIDDFAGVLDADVELYVDDIIVNDNPSPRTVAIEGGDKVKPVIESASLVNVYSSKAILSLSATDLDEKDEATVVTSYLANDADNGIVDYVLRVDANGQATIKGLLPSTSYNLALTARDKSGNVSENSIIVTFTTEAIAEYLVLDDFESGDCIWRPENGSFDVEVIDNPFSGGINTTAKVLKTGRPVGSVPWAAAMMPALGVDGGVYKYAHFMMYRSTFGANPKAKFSDQVGGDISPVPDTQIEMNKWHDVVFDIQSIGEGKTLDFIYFMFDSGENLSEDLIVYIDEIILNNSITPRSAETTVHKENDLQYVIATTQGAIVLSNLNGEQVSIYNSNGQLIASEKSTDKVLTISVQSGVYLVQIDNKSLKVLVK